MKRLLCRLFGHRMAFVGHVKVRGANGRFARKIPTVRCQRCGEERQQVELVR